MFRVGKGSWAGPPMTFGNMREMGVRGLNTLIAMRTT
jgi:hypothetical protein